MGPSLGNTCFIFFNGVTTLQFLVKSSRQNSTCSASALFSLKWLLVGFLFFDENNIYNAALGQRAYSSTRQPSNLVDFSLKICSEKRSVSGSSLADERLPIPDELCDKRTPDSNSGRLITYFDFCTNFFQFLLKVVLFSIQNILQMDNPKKQEKFM